jgi:hypothetical protein
MDGFQLLAHFFLGINLLAFAMNKFANQPVSPSLNLLLAARGFFS